MDEGCGERRRSRRQKRLGRILLCDLATSNQGGFASDRFPAGQADDGTSEAPKKEETAAGKGVFKSFESFIRPAGYAESRGMRERQKVHHTVERGQIH